MMAVKLHFNQEYGMQGPAEIAGVACRSHGMRVNERGRMGQGEGQDRGFAMARDFRIA